MSIWESIARGGAKVLRGTEFARGRRKIYRRNCYPSCQNTDRCGKNSSKTAVGGATGYVAWESIINDKSVVETVRSVVGGNDRQDCWCRWRERFKEKAGKRWMLSMELWATSTANGADGQFLPWYLGGNGLDMFGFFKNLEQAMFWIEPCGLVAAAFSHSADWMARQDSRCHVGNDVYR